MKNDAATLKRFAELLKVDEVKTFDTIRPAYGFMLRIGVLWQKVEIDEADLCRVSLDKRIEHIVRILFESAQNLRWQVEQEQRSVFTRNLIGEAERQSAWLTPIIPNEVEFIPLRMNDADLGLEKYKEYVDYLSSSIASTFAMPADLLGVEAKTTDSVQSETPKPAGRFEMICLELEDL